LRAKTDDQKERTERGLLGFDSERKGPEEWAQLGTCRTAHPPTKGQSTKLQGVFPGGVAGRQRRPRGKKHSEMASRAGKNERILVKGSESHSIIKVTKTRASKGKVSKIPRKTKLTFEEDVTT